MLKKNHFINSSRTVWGLAVSILVVGHLLGACFSFGFHQPDEHFQIWEWANYFLGLSQTNQNLPWEYTTQIRPWFQPLFHAGFMQLFIKLGIFDPFSTAFFFRCLYACLNVLGLITLFKAVQKRFGWSDHWLIVISLFWFMPYLHVRTSSENLAGILLTFAFALLLNEKKLCTTGFFFGLAFLARYQIALGLAGMAAYLIYRDRRITADHVRLFVGFCLALALGAILDRIGYGNWVFTPYRYFQVNLLQGVAATYNPYPWYQYFIWLAELNPFLSLPLLFGITLFFRNPRSNRLLPMAVFVGTFFLIHCLIANKEYRFLFPVLNLVPFIAVAGLQGSFPLTFANILNRPGFWICLVFFNVPAFMISTLHGASPEPLWALETAHRLAKKDAIWFSNFDYNAGNTFQYYKLSNHSVVTFEDAQGLSTLLQSYPPTKVLIRGKLDDPKITELLNLLESHRCIAIASAYPQWLYSLHSRVTAIRRIPYQALFDCSYSQKSNKS